MNTPFDPNKTYSVEVLPAEVFSRLLAYYESVGGDPDDLTPKDVLAFRFVGSDYYFLLSSPEGGKGPEVVARLTLTDYREREVSDILPGEYETFPEYDRARDAYFASITPDALSSLFSA